MHIGIVIMVMCNVLCIALGESVCTVPNTGSVLFRMIDVDRRHCWSREEAALLYTRRAVMELVPRQIPHNIPLILEYMQISLAVLKEMAPSKVVYDYTLAALADTFGGYLQTYGLPLLHEAYYEGYVSYDNTAQFHKLQDNFKEILMTNGEGWTRAMEVRKHVNRILPLKMSGLSGNKPCPLLFTDASGLVKQDEESSQNQNATLIPLPILDDNKNPNSIAVPFKSHALYNLKSRSSYDILIKYYVDTTRCISQAQQSGSEQSEFDLAFSRWLKSKVIPRLKDEDWYVGFSNVLRIEETIQQKGGMVVAGQPKQQEEDSLFSELESNGNISNPWYLITAFLIILLSILFICFLYWALVRKCCSPCCGRRDDDSLCEDPSDTTSLISGPVYPYSYPSSTKLVDGPASARTVHEENRFTMSCGLGKGFKRCNQHHHH